MKTKTKLKSALATCCGGKRDKLKQAWMDGADAGTRLGFEFALRSIEKTMAGLSIARELPDKPKK